MSEVVVVRAGVVESVHRVHAAVVDGAGRVVFHRSAAKPFQAVPLVEDGVVERLGLTQEELALCCASHNGEQAHVAAAAAILEKAGLCEDDLECGPHLPYHEDSAAALLASGEGPRPIHNNCSGKHAGMLALARVNGWPTRDYIRAEHPVQRRMLREILRWSGMDEADVEVGQDGCGVVSFATPLDRLALSFARLGGERGPPRQIVEAMTSHPFMVAGTGRFGTVLVEAAGARLFAKTGAEGVYGVGTTDGGLGVAVKVEDGGQRASSVALLHILDELGVLDGITSEALDARRTPMIKNTLGEDVGQIRADFDLERFA